MQVYGDGLNVAIRCGRLPPAGNVTHTHSKDIHDSLNTQRYVHLATLYANRLLYIVVL